MKYSNDIFKLSAEVHDKNDLLSNDIDENIKKKQDKLLEVLIKRIKEKIEFENRQNLEDSFFRIKIFNPYGSNFDSEYKEIDELVKSNNFDSFAREYCMYLEKIEPSNDAWKINYYEVIWDYKTYFEQLKSTKSGKKAIRKIKRKTKKVRSR